MTNFQHIERLAVSLLVALMLNTTGLAQSSQPEVRDEVRLETHVRPHPHPHPHIHNDWEESELTVTEQETISKSYTLPVSAERRSLTVDNIWGSVHVTGGSSDQVQLVARKTIRAESKDALDLAKKEVTLDITQQGSLLKFYVNGPFRCQCKCENCTCRTLAGAQAPTAKT